MYIETWYKTWCPDCNAVNWVCNGDMSDMTAVDVTGVSCWKCKNQYPLDDETDDEDCDEYCDYYPEGRLTPE